MKVTFMGTAGARFMVAKQLAASGGLYLEEGGVRLSLDPGPGAIVQYAKRKVDLTKLDAIILSHRHLDHAGDVNVMVEAMTEGGFRHRGRLFCPSDALDDDPVVLQYLRQFPQEVVRLQPETTYNLNGFAFATTPRHVHQAEVMIIHLVLMECRAGLPHLCLADAERIIRDAKPRLAILTHFGMTVWRAHPWELAADLTQRLGTEVKAARDGMVLEI